MNKALGKVEISTKPDAIVGEWNGGGVCWDPHSSSNCAVASGCSLQIIDTRKMEIIADTFAHRGGIRFIAILPCHIIYLPSIILSITPYLLLEM